VTGTPIYDAMLAERSPRPQPRPRPHVVTDVRRPWRDGLLILLGVLAVVACAAWIVLTLTANPSGWVR
jgi:hypothetical protein